MRRILPWLAALTVGVWSVDNIHDTDVWWHLASGRWMWDHGALLSADPFTWTVSGRHWLNYEWLFQAVFYGVYRMADIPGLLLFKALFWTLAALGFYRSCDEELPPGLKILALLAAFSAMRFRNFARAELVSFCLFPWFMAATFKVMQGELAWRRWAWLSVPLMAVWANCHAAFWHVLAITAIAAAAWWLRNRKAANPFLFLGLLYGAAGLLNPFGLEIYTRTLHNAHMFLSVDWADFNEYAPTVLGEHHAFWLIFAGSWGLLFAKAWKERKIDAFLWGVMAYASWLGPRFVRNIPFALMLLIPVAARSIKLSARGAWNAGACLACAALIIVGVRRMSWGVEESRYPVKAAEFVLQNRPAGAGFNDFDFGSYLIWAFYGKGIPIFVDGRIHAIDGYREVWKQVSRARAFSPAALNGWNGLLSQWRFDWCLMQVPPYRLQFEGRPLSVFSYYFPEARWALVHHDGAAAVYVRRDAAHKALIERFEVKGVYPDGGDAPAGVPWERLFEEAR